MFGAVTTKLGCSRGIAKLEGGRLDKLPLVRSGDAQPVTGDRVVDSWVLILLRVMTQDRTGSGREE